MDLESAIRLRRTHKAFHPDPLEREVIEELVELARWAPNHHLTNPWRFRVLGQGSLARLKAVTEAAKPGSSTKLDRAPTLVVASALLDGEDSAQDRENLLATAVAAYLVLLVAHGRGLAGYWRTLSVLDTPEGRGAVGLGEGETPVALLHLGYPRQAQRVPERAPVTEILSFLD